MAKNIDADLLVDDEVLDDNDDVEDILAPVKLDKNAEARRLLEIQREQRMLEENLKDFYD